MKKREKVKQPVGRPKIIPDIIEVEKLASQGLTLEQIAHCLGISYKTLNERKKEFEDFSEAVKRGQAAGIQQVTSALFQNVRGGNVTAQIFYLKCRAGWKEVTVNEHSGLDGKPIQQDVVNTVSIQCIDERIAELIK